MLQNITASHITSQPNLLSFLEKPILLGNCSKTRCWRRWEHLFDSTGREWEGISTPWSWMGQSHLKQRWWSLA